MMLQRRNGYYQGEGRNRIPKETYSYIVKNGFIYNYKTDQGVFKSLNTLRTGLPQ